MISKTKKMLLISLLTFILIQLKIISSNSLPNDFETLLVKDDLKSLLTALSTSNQETRTLLETKLVQWVSEKFRITPDEFRSFVARIPQEEIYKFQDSLQVYLDTAGSIYPLNETTSQLFYPSLMIAVKNALSTSHTISPPDQGFDKMNDTLFLPILGQSDAAIFITYKIIAEEPNKLKSTAKAGLWDMYFRPYDHRWKPLSHIKKIIEICMAFYNEKVHVQFSIEKFKQS